MGRGSGSRVCAHSHIRGLALDSDGLARECVDFVGQSEAREACGLVVEMIRMRRLAGRAVVLAGPVGSGKTALAMGMARELGERVPFCVVSGAEVYSKEVKRTEILTSWLRQAIGVRVREVKDVYEGEVVELVAEEADENAARILTAVLLTLKSTAGTKCLRLAPKVHEQLLQQHIEAGDVVHIQAQTGSVKRLGRVDSHSRGVDLDCDTFVPLPKGPVLKTQEVVQELSLHDLDEANSHPGREGGGVDIASIVGEYMTPRKTEITEKLRAEVDKIVNNYVQEGLAEVTPGVLFVDEAHMLDLQCFAFLNRALENEHAPTLIFATNRHTNPVRGSAHTEGPQHLGLPADFVDRVLIVPTRPHTQEEFARILEIRAHQEDLTLTPEALARLLAIGSASSLRQACQLLTPAASLTHEPKTTLTHQDISEAYDLFHRRNWQTNEHHTPTP